MSYFLFSRVTQGRETLWFYNLFACLRVSLPIQPLVATGNSWGYIAFKCLQQGAYREEKFDVTLPWWQSFWISTICLDRDGRKKSMGYCFVPECNPAQESHTCQVFSFFFSAILAGLRLLRSTNFATMATWRNDFSSLFECAINTTPPPPPPPHTHPTCSCLFTSLCKPWCQSAYSPNCSLCICCCTKVKRSAYSSRYLDLLQVDLTSFLASGGSLLGEEKSSRKFSKYFSNRQSLFSITVVFLFIPAMFLRK